MFGSPIQAMSVSLEMQSDCRIGRSDALSNAVPLERYEHHGYSKPMIGTGNFRCPGVPATGEWSLPQSSLGSYGARLIRVNANAFRGWEGFLSHNVQEALVTIDLFRTPLKFSEMTRQEQ
jgi:hypothetical protein